jgi:hypothetical protein
MNGEQNGEQHEVQREQIAHTAQTHSVRERKDEAINHWDFHLQRDGEKYSQPLNQEGFLKKIVTVDIPILA